MLPSHIPADPLVAKLLFAILAEIERRYGGVVEVGLNEDCTWRVRYDNILRGYDRGAPIRQALGVALWPKTDMYHGYNAVYAELQWEGPTGWPSRLGYSSKILLFLQPKDVSLLAEWLVEPKCRCEEYWFPKNRREELRKSPHGWGLAHQVDCPMTDFWERRAKLSSTRGSNE